MDYCRIQQSKLPWHLHHDEKRVVSIGNANSYRNADPDCDSHRYANSNGNANTESDCNRNPDIDADFSVHCS